MLNHTKKLKLGQKITLLFLPGPRFYDLNFKVGPGYVICMIVLSILLLCGEVILSDCVVSHMPLVMIMFDTCE